MSMECFTTEELEELTPHQLELLTHATQREVRNNPEIRRILREKFGPMRDRMVAQSRPRRTTRRSPGPSGSE
jgi:hypothetical protein